MRIFKGYFNPYKKLLRNIFHPKIDTLHISLIWTYIIQIFTIPRKKINSIKLNIIRRANLNYKKKIYASVKLEETNMFYDRVTCFFGIVSSIFINLLLHIHSFLFLIYY